MYLVWRDEKCIQNCTWKNLKGGNHWRDLGINGMCSKLVLNKLSVSVWAGLSWFRIGLSGELVNTVMNIWIP
jgi:hypothetical protein